MTSSWFFLSTLNYDARSTTHQKNEDSSDTAGWTLAIYSFVSGNGLSRRGTLSRYSVNNGSTFFKKTDTHLPDRKVLQSVKSTNTIIIPNLLRKSAERIVWNSVVRSRSMDVDEERRTTLLIIERKIFRRIYGPKYENGERKSRTNRN